SYRGAIEAHRATGHERNRALPVQLQLEGNLVPGGQVCWSGGATRPRCNALWSRIGCRSQISFAHHLKSGAGTPSRSIIDSRNCTINSGDEPDPYGVGKQVEDTELRPEKPG